MSTFIMQEQVVDQWCWAAVAASLNNYIAPNPPLEQCEVVKRVLKVQGDCCRNPENFNEQGSLTKALDVLHRQAGEPVLGPVTFSQIRQNIDGGWPIPVRIVWDSHPGIAHSVVISGYTVSRSGAPLVQVDDPFFGKSIVDYDTFVSSYRGSGRWERTYKLA
jgi:hypothetical protein